MQGSIYKRILKDGNPRYYAVYRNPAGKQKTKTFSRRKDAEKFLTDTVKTVNDGGYVDVQPRRMEEVFDHWLSHSLEVKLKMGQLKPSTAEIYKSTLRAHIRPFFKDDRSDRLTPARVSDWVKEMAEEIGEGNIAPKTFNNIRGVFHTILKWARHPARGYMAHDPLLGIEPLPKRQVERIFLEHEEIERLLRAAEPPTDSIIYLAAYSGLRRGELFGLQWGDVDWGNGTDGGRLRIRRSNWRLKMTTPKTESSIRNVDVCQKTLNELEAYRFGFPPLKGDFIFRRPDGRPFHPGVWHKQNFRSLLKKAELSRILTLIEEDDERAGLHCLRHTYASILISSGENIKYISRQMGHATVAITMDIYGHLLAETSTAAMKRLDERIPDRERATGSSNKNLTDQAKTAKTACNRIEGE